MKCPKCRARIELMTTACAPCGLDLTEDRTLRESRRIAKIGRWALLVVAVSSYVMGRDLLDTQIAQAKADRWGARTSPEQLQAAKDRAFIVFVALLSMGGFLGIGFIAAPYQPFWTPATAAALYGFLAAISFLHHALRGQVDDFLGPQIIFFGFLRAAYHARRFERRLTVMANDWTDTPPPGPAHARR